MIVLVRDPRAVFSSRWSGRIAEWCRNDHCSDPATACGDLMEDVEAARRLTAELPGKVRECKGGCWGYRFGAGRTVGWSR